MNQHLSHEQLSDYLDDELVDDERRRMQSHLTTCSVCAGELAAMEALSADLRAMPVDRNATQRLRPLAMRAVRHRSYARPALMAAAMAAVAAGALLITERERESYQPDQAAAAALLVIDRAISDLQREAERQPSDAVVHELLQHAQQRRAQVLADARALSDRG